MSEWQPIETAPRDGTSVLVYMPAHTWHPESDLTITDAATMEVAVWSEIYNGWSSDYGMRGTTTHWMPLPEPLK